MPQAKKVGARKAKGSTKVKPLDAAFKNFHDSLKPKIRFENALENARRALARLLKEIENLE